jgi:hypothetical protein
LVAARDFCLRHRRDDETALRGFTWPGLEYLNWAELERERRTRGERSPFEFFEQEFVAGQHRGNS